MVYIVLLYLAMVKSTHILVCQSLVTPLYLLINFYIFSGGILNGGKTLPPVILPIGALLLNSFNTSLPALLISGGSLLIKPPNTPPALFTVGSLNSDCPTCISPALSIK